MTDSEWRGWVWVFWGFVVVALGLVAFAAYVGFH